MAGGLARSLVSTAAVVLLLNAAFLFSSSHAAPTTYDVNWSTSSSDLFTEIAVGDTVRWTWRDFAPHTVKSTNPSFNFGSAQGAEFNNVAQNGFQFSYTFTQAGSYSYTCNVHRGMSGTVSVTAPPVDNYTVPWSLSSPSTVKTIQAGETVKWVWGDGIPHSVKSTTAGFSFGNAEGAESNTVAQNGFQFTYTFDLPGTYTYTCYFHSTMEGKVVVLPTGGLTSPPPAAKSPPPPSPLPPAKASPPPPKVSVPPPTKVSSPPPVKNSPPPPKSSPPPPKKSPPPPKKSPPPPKASSPPPKKSPPPPKKKPPPPKK